MSAYPWLIPSKLAAPEPPPGRVPRPLDGPVGAAAITVVAAGAGFGKTIALADWLAAAARGGAVPAWFAADPGDGDPATFFHYLTAGVRASIPAFGAEVEALLAADVRDPRVLWPRFFQAACAYGPAGLAIAIDDAHHLHEACPELLKALVALGDRLPAGVRVALSSRRHLPLGLARLQASGLARMVAPDALRFGPDEAAAFLAARLGGEPTADQHRRAAALDGWPLGLALLAAGAAEPGAGADDALTDFVAEELVGTQPEARRAFMVRAALLDELTADVCREVFDDEAAAAHLSALEAAMLIQRLGVAGWRFPGYLAEWLREEAQRVLPAGDQEAWRRRAAAYHLTRGADERAIPYLLAVGAWAEALAACDRCFPAMRHAGRAQVLAAWLAAFPVASDEPALGLWRANALAREGRADEALAAYEAAGKAYAARGDHAGAFKALVRRADLALIRGDEKAVGPLVMQALARQAEGRGEDVVDLHFVRGRAAELRGDVALMEACNEAVLEVPAGDNVEVAASHVVARINLFTAALHRGELARARRHADEAVRLADERRFHPWHLFARFLRAHLDMVAGDREAAGSFLAALPAGWADQLDWFDQALARVVLAQWLEGRDDFKAAEAELTRAWSLFERAGHREGLKVPLERLLWLAIRRRQPGRAPTLVAEVYGEGPWPGPDGLRNVHDLAIAVPLARARHLQGDHAGAQALLEAAIPELEGAGAKLHLARARLFEAATRLATGDVPGAQAALGKGLKVVEAGGFDFLRQAEQALWAELAPLLAAGPGAPLAPASGPALPPGAAPTTDPPLVIRLFGDFDVRLDGLRIDAWPRKKSKWVLAALALAPRGLTPPELAEQLGGLSANSLPTVKMALSGLRKALEPAIDHSDRFVRHEGERYQLAPSMVAWCDVQAFAAAMQRGDRTREERPAQAAEAYAEALAAYRGELLPDAEGFEAEREGFRQRALDAALWLAARHGAAGEVAPAEALLRRAVEVAPAEEAPYLALMRHYQRHGRPERVRQVYWDHRKARHAALGLPPTASFEAAHGAIARGEPGT